MNSGLHLPHYFPNGTSGGWGATYKFVEFPAGYRRVYKGYRRAGDRIWDGWQGKFTIMSYQHVHIRITKFDVVLRNAFTNVTYGKVSRIVKDVLNKIYEDDGIQQGIMDEAFDLVPHHEGRNAMNDNVEKLAEVIIEEITGDNLVSHISNSIIGRVLDMQAGR